MREQKDDVPVASGENLDGEHVLLHLLQCTERCMHYVHGEHSLSSLLILGTPSPVDVDIKLMSTSTVASDVGSHDAILDYIYPLAPYIVVRSTRATPSSEHA